MTASAARVVLGALTKQFGDKVALDHVDLAVEPGRFLVLLGPSGSGKTTLLRCLAGIERPSSGTIEVGGREVVGPRTFVPPHKRDLAMVFQDYALWPHLTVEKNVAFPLKRGGTERAGRAGRVGEMLDRVGIAHLAQRYPNELSGGEQQRVALARALVAEVGLVLFDEPLSNLDADRRDQLRLQIGILTREQGATSVYITHDQAEAFALADVVGVLREGRLVQLAPPEEVYTRPADAFVARFTGVAGEFDVEIGAPIGADRFEVVLKEAGGPRVVATAPGGELPHGAVRLFLRARGIALRGDDPSAALRGEIRDVAFTGQGYEHVVALASGRQLSKVFSDTRYERGSAVALDVDPAQCLLLADDAPQDPSAPDAPTDPAGPSDEPAAAPAELDSAMIISKR